MTHSLRVNGSSNVVYIDHIAKDLEECLVPQVARNLPAIWGAELDSRIDRLTVWDQPEIEAGTAELSFDIWDQHNTRFTVFATWELCSRPCNIGTLTIEEHDTVYGD